MRFTWKKKTTQILYCAVAFVFYASPCMFTSSEINDKFFVFKGPYTTFLLKPKGSTIPSLYFFLTDFVKL